MLVPTRELASQVRDELALLAGPRGSHIEAFYGGNGFGKQLNALRRGVDIAVACPGRLMDLINRGDIKLDAVEFVVIDEADRMADMGFLPEVRKHPRPHPEGPPDAAVLGHPRRRHRRAGAQLPAQPGPPRAGQGPDRRRQGRPTCSGTWPATSACRCAPRSSARPARPSCSAAPSAAPTGSPASSSRPALRTAAIHGDRSQSQRERALESFHRGQVDALVATDVAARGIHVDGVSAVVHLDPPADEKDYVHRSGRTGRAGAEGVVVTFVAPELRKDVTKMLKILKMPQVITSPDADGLPVLERPARKVRAVAPAARRRSPGPRRATGIGLGPARPTGRAAAPRPAVATVAPGARTGVPGRRSRESDDGSASKPRSAKAGGPAKAGRQARRQATGKSAGNRKTRRAHLQPGGGPAAGASAGSSGRPSRGSKRAGAPNPDKGKRRQPSGNR